MTNGIFSLAFDEKLGGINVLSFNDDAYQMNFCKEGRAFGTVKGYTPTEFYVQEGKVICVAKVQPVPEQEKWMKPRARKHDVIIRTEFAFVGENVKITHSIKNEHKTPVYFKEGDIAFYMPLFDAYDSSIVCHRSRCHAHIFAGGDSTYIRGERMGEQPYNLGIVFTEGNIASYSQEGAVSNNRGYFLMNAKPFHLLSGEEKTFAYEMFLYNGGNDGFMQKAKQYANFLQAIAPKYTFTQNEKIVFEVESKDEIHSYVCQCKGENVQTNVKGNRLKVEITPTSLGDKKVEFIINGATSHALFNVILPYEQLIEKRIRFIVEKQQCLEENSPLYGAYIVYDNEDEAQYFDDNFPDHNACRERHGMAIVIAKWLQTHHDDAIKASLDKYIEFLFREGYDEETGEVFNCIGKRREPFRLYNILWTTTFFTEMFKLTKEEVWLDRIEASIRFYYANGGNNFYPNAITMYDFFEVLLANGRKCEDIFASFDEHIENIIKNDVDYPAHEVNFEQVILTAAVALLLDKYQLCREERYLREAKRHMDILRKLDGSQPDYHMHDIAIRYWDDYWFGKYGTYGDVFPHYWSSLSGCCYCTYAAQTGDEEMMKMGMHSIENTACLYSSEGRGYCSYLYPRETNGYRAQRFNAYANDQDWALYYMMKYCSVDF